MDTSQASEHLQIIRTLMERSAVYRRALAPIMTLNGVLGCAGAIVAWRIGLDNPRNFICYWTAVAAIAMIGSFLLVRRQALKDAEPFWSPPTRRVTHAMLPPMVVGAAITGMFWINRPPPNLENVLIMLWLPLAWIVLYGCALHSAGFFVSRGVRLFGWIFVLAGSAVLAAGIPDQISHSHYGNLLMGSFFGGLHLAAGIYLYFTEKNRSLP